MFTVKAFNTFLLKKYELFLIIIGKQKLEWLYFVFWIINTKSTGTIKVPSTYEDVFVIPQFATVDLQGTKMVYVVNDDNTVKTVPLTITAQTNKEFIVKDGFENGNTIVTEGVSKLKDGQTINPVKQ